MAMLFGIGALAWYVKPVAGLLVDGIALFGTHRRYYLIMSALLASAPWVLLGIVSHSYLLLLGGIVAMQCMLVIGSTVLGGFLVERGKLLRAEGRLVSCRMFVENACVLIAGPLAGYLAGLPFGTVAIVGAAIAAVVAPIAAMYLADPIQEKSTLVGAKYLLSDIKSMLNSRAIWLVAIFALISSIPHSFGNASLFLSEERSRFLRCRNWIHYGFGRTWRPGGLRSISIPMPTISDAMAPDPRNARFLSRNSSLSFLRVAPQCAINRVSEWVSLRDRYVGSDAERGSINFRLFRSVWVCRVYE